MISSVGSVGRVRAFFRESSRERAAFAVAGTCAGLVSGSRNQAATKFTSDSAAANSGGAACPQRLNTPPIAGPKTKPRPKAAPIRPIPFARFSGVVVSAMTAWAVETVAPAMPANIRETNSSGSDPARPKTR